MLNLFMIFGFIFVEHGKKGFVKRYRYDVDWNCNIGYYDASVDQSAYSEYLTMLFKEFFTMSLRRLLPC